MSHKTTASKGFLLFSAGLSFMPACGDDTGVETRTGLTTGAMEGISTETTDSASEGNSMASDDSTWTTTAAGSSTGEVEGSSGEPVDDTHEASEETGFADIGMIVDTPTDPLAAVFGDTKMVNAIDGWWQTKKWKSTPFSMPYSPPPGWVIVDQFNNSTQHGAVSYLVSTFGPGQFVTAQQVDEVFKLAIEAAAKKGDKGLEAVLKLDWAKKKQYAYMVASTVQTINVNGSISAHGTWPFYIYTSWLDLDIDAEIMYVADEVPKDKQMLKQQIEAKYGISLDAVPLPPPLPPAPICGDGIKESCSGEECEPGELLPYGWACDALCKLKCWKGNCPAIPSPDTCL